MGLILGDSERFHERRGDIVDLVMATPGMTAQWYVAKLMGPGVREDFTYNRFYRTVRSGVIVGFHKPDAGRVFYYPRGQKPEWAENRPSEMPQVERSGCNQG